ncbi:MAG: hypothetical protein VYD71_00230 [Bacteroidota bacterium]|nr:hypothetical protein [Bacteroidota bacterium]
MKNLIYFSIFCIFTFSACEESQSRGCTDPIAVNYKSWADINDGSCIYEAYIVFHMDYNAAAFLNDEPGVLSLEYVVDNIEVGKDVYDFFDVATNTTPYCHQVGFTTATIEWYNPNDIEISFEAIDNLGEIQWYGKAWLSPNECVDIPLEYESNLTKDEKDNK